MSLLQASVCVMWWWRNVCVAYVCVCRERQLQITTEVCHCVFPSSLCAEFVEDVCTCAHCVRIFEREFASVHLPDLDAHHLPSRQ